MHKALLVALILIFLLLIFLFMNKSETGYFSKFGSKEWYVVGKIEIAKGKISFLNEKD